MVAPQRLRPRSSPPPPPPHARATTTTRTLHHPRPHPAPPSCRQRELREAFAAVYSVETSSCNNGWMRGKLLQGEGGGGGGGEGWAGAGPAPGPTQHGVHHTLGPA